MRILPSADAQQRTRKPRFVAVKAALLLRNESVAHRFRAGHINRNLTGRMRWGFAPNPTRVGAPPWTRRRRMLRDVDHQQLAAVAWMTQFTASGQASFAGQAVRMRTAKNLRQAEKNESTHFFGLPQIFLLPGSSLCDIQVTGANCL